jgi:hypothetical protein
MINRHRKLCMEQMEAREMMAGDIAANVTNGNLNLNEAAGQAGRDNSVLISQIAPGRIRVTGLGSTTDGTKSLINGAAFQDFNVSGNLSVNFGGGNDLVNFDATAPPSFQDVTLNLGAPPLVVSRGATAANAGGPVAKPLGFPDKDNVMIWDANIRGSLTINTGADDDWVYIANAKIGDGVGIDNITINTGAGADTAELKNLHGQINGAIDIQTFSSLNENDADCAWLENVTALGNIGVRTGGGQDLIHLDHVTSFKDINLDAGVGDDAIEINYAVAVDNFFANLGDGNDNIAINDLYVINKATKIDGGAGSDSITKTGAFPTSQVTQTSFEWVNGRPVLVISPVLNGGVLAKA